MHRTGPRGLGRSYVDGLKRALETDATLICQMDADLSHNPEVPAGARCRGRHPRRRDRLPLPAGHQRRQLAAASDLPERLRQPVHQGGHRTVACATAPAAIAAGAAKRWPSSGWIASLPKATPSWWKCCSRRRARAPTSVKYRSFSSSAARGTRRFPARCSSNHSSPPGGSRCAAGGDGGESWLGEVVVMVTSSYPRFPGDSVGTFMEPIARSVAARGHIVHVVAPWHPLVARKPVEHGVHFHFYKYAPIPALNVFGYAEGMRADVRVRRTAWARDAAGARGRVARGAEGRPRAPRDDHARPLGCPRRGSRRHSRRHAFRWSSVCTGRTSMSPSASCRRGSRRDARSSMPRS